MGSQKFFQCLLVFGTALWALGIFLFFQKGEVPTALLSQNTNTYLGPNQKIPGKPKLIQLQLLVYNDPNPKGVLIVSASFDGTTVPLKPSDIYGFRGQASFQKGPGKYKLRWEVERDEKSWPRTVSHEEDVTLDARDLWIQITIMGDKAEIS